MFSFQCKIILQRNEGSFTETIRFHFTASITLLSLPLKRILSSLSASPGRDFPVLGKGGLGKRELLSREDRRSVDPPLFTLTPTAVSFAINLPRQRAGSSPHCPFHCLSQETSVRRRPVVLWEGRRAAGESGLEWRTLTQINSSHVSSSPSVRRMRFYQNM